MNVSSANVSFSPNELVTPRRRRPARRRSEPAVAHHSVHEAPLVRFARARLVIFRAASRAPHERLEVGARPRRNVREELNEQRALCGAVHRDVQGAVLAAGFLGDAPHVRLGQSLVEDLVRRVLVGVLLAAPSQQRVDAADVSRRVGILGVAAVAQHRADVLGHARERVGEQSLHEQVVIDGEQRHHVRRQPGLGVREELQRLLRLLERGVVELAGDGDDRHRQKRVAVHTPAPSRFGAGVKISRSNVKRRVPRSVSSEKPVRKRLTSASRSPGRRLAAPALARAQRRPAGPETVGGGCRTRVSRTGPPTGSHGGRRRGTIPCFFCFRKFFAPNGIIK